MKRIPYNKNPNFLGEMMLKEVKENGYRYKSKSIYEYIYPCEN